MVYFLFLFVLTVFTFFEFIGKNYCVFGSKTYEKSIYTSMAIVLTLFAGLRFEVGRDWDAYVYYFDNCLTLNGSGNFEYGYYLLNILFKSFTDNYYVMQFAITVFCSFVIFKYIYDKSSKPIFTLLIYYMFWFIWLNMAIQRQLIAIAILILGMSFVEQKKVTKWLGTIFIATLFHISAFAAFPLYYTAKLKISKKSAMLILIVSIVFSFIGRDIVLLFVRFANSISWLPMRIHRLADFYINSAHGMKVGYNTIFGFLGHTIFYLLIVCLYNNEIENSDNAYMVNFLIGVFCIEIGRNFLVLSRIQYYYFLCGLGVLSYNLLDRKSLPKICGRIFEKKTELLLCLSLLTMFIFVYFVAMYMSFYTNIKMQHDFFNYKIFLFR